MKHADHLIRAAVILAAILLAFAFLTRHTSTAHRLERDVGELRWDAPQRPTWLIVDPSARASAEVVARAADAWNTASGAAVWRVDTSTIGAAEFARGMNAYEGGAGLAPIGGVLVVSGEMSILAEPPTEGANDGLMGARLWWGPNGALAFGVVRIPDLSAAPEFVALPMAVHVLGHALGLGHSTDDESVMAAESKTPLVREDRVLPSQHLTEDDVDAVRDAR